MAWHLVKHKYNFACTFYVARYIGRYYVPLVTLLSCVWLSKGLHSNNSGISHLEVAELGCIDI